MADGMKTILYKVQDLAASKAVFTKLLGVDPAQDSDYYVGFDIGGQHIGLAPGGDEGVRGGVCYTHVDDIEGTLEALLAAGAEENEKITKVGPGRRVATVKDPSGNVIGILQDG